jgi:hypothetical protein
VATVLFGGGLENRHCDDAIAESHASPRTFGAENEILHSRFSVGAEKAHLLIRPFLTFWTYRIFSPSGSLSRYHAKK